MRLNKLFTKEYTYIDIAFSKFNILFRMCRTYGISIGAYLTLHRDSAALILNLIFIAITLSTQLTEDIIEEERCASCSTSIDTGCPEDCPEYEPHFEGNG